MFSRRHLIVMTLFLSLIAAFASFSAFYNFFDQRVIGTVILIEVYMLVALAYFLRPVDNKNQPLKELERQFEELIKSAKRTSRLSENLSDISKQYEDDIRRQEQRLNAFQEQNTVVQKLIENLDEETRAALEAAILKKAKADRFLFKLLEHAIAFVLGFLTNYLAFWLFGS